MELCQVYSNSCRVVYISPPTHLLCKVSVFFHIEESTKIILPFQATQEEWMYVFILAACLNFAAFIFYAIFGSAEVQDWARVDDDDDLPAKEVNLPEMSNSQYVNNAFVPDPVPNKKDLESSTRF